ncbi:hypothetical protein [Maridesulfovibrio salexigens]|uniref:ABC-type transport auxiliary lipoprotein component domain-containing protein n=1 Tax=Maridesulfovibrio salexigens (strain ATCC 14822 / DSM 2638 / NCIMB 8403 / VKM B-1763) TaxID=526222 RepID=C6BS94_MARSD|nr:hypothetical protein [Maridesulfovibrio salexigens]ACS79570.1 hypothetical protein Desal_1508 [Maridesulfovibrio salexigens DSM 2638]
MFKHFVVILFVLSSLVGCSSKPIVLDYSPSSTMTVDGNFKVGDFSYLPAENDHAIKPNQIKNTALGSILFEKNIDKYFEDALFTEARFVGVDMKKNENVVSGEIKEFLIDDIGFSVDWRLDVNYVVQKQDGLGQCYNKSHLVTKSTSKFANAFGTIREIIKLNIEQLFADPEFVKCIR